MLAQRVRRGLDTLGRVRREQGLAEAGVFALRVLRHKSFLALTHVLALPQARRLRLHRRAERAALTAALPPPGGEVSVAVAVTGGVGDLIVCARFLRDLRQAAPGVVFDLFCPRPALAEWIFAGVPGFRQPHHDILFDALRRDYTVALRVNQTVVSYEADADWPALRRQPALVEVLMAIRKSRRDVEDFIQQHPYRDNFLARTAVFSGASRRDSLHRMAGIRYGGDRYDLSADAFAPARFGLVPGRYVTVHNGYDPDFIIAGSRATKCYPHFGPVIERLRQDYPDLAFVQVGTSTSEPIAACDLDLIGRTTLPEAAGLLAGAALHLDNEGGLVHLAACHGVRSVVVFGPTPSAYFGYPGNVNIDPAVCGDCWWLTRSWMERCAKGHAVPRCLHETPPDLVALRAAAALRIAARAVPAPAPGRPAAALPVPVLAAAALPAGGN